MTARPCPECGGLVASTINQCPHCGYNIGVADGSPRMERSENPYNSLAYVIIAIILFWPLGLISLYYHVKSDDRWSAGDVKGAELYGGNSRRFANIAIYLVLTLLGMWILLLMLFIAI